MSVKNLDDIKSIVMLSSKLQNLFEGFDETNKSAMMTSKVKILLEVSQTEKISPSALKNKVGLAKSNIAILCNKLQNDGLIDKHRDGFDTREIYYSITEDGKKFLSDFLKKAKKNFEGELAYKNNMEQINMQVKDLLNLID